MKRIGLIVLVATLLGGMFLGTVQAQIKQFNIAQTLTIGDAEAQDGDIMSLGTENETLVRAEKPYDERMYGVLVESPVMVYRTKDTIPVTRYGDTFVNVTTLNGSIAVGDYITSSEIPGKGMKATDFTGYMLGVALASFAEADGTPVTVNGLTASQGRIRVSLGIGPASPAQVKAAGGVFGTLRRLTDSVIFNLRTSRQLDRFIRYILAIIVLLITIIISFRTFGRNITKGIEAIGRNPLAKVSIQSMIVLNVIMILLVTLGGVILSLVIISL